MSDRHIGGAEETVARTVQQDLRTELRALGFDAFDAGVTFDDLRRGDGSSADYYVEIVSSRAGDLPLGGVGIGGRDIAVDLAVVVSRVAAQVLLYDGRTLDLLERYDLAQSRTTVLPTAIGLGGRSV